MPIASPVSIPLAAQAPSGNESPITTNAAAQSTPCLRPRTIPPTRAPSAVAAPVHATTPSTLARTSATSASPPESGASSSAHGSGVTPSVDAP